VSRPERPVPPPLEGNDRVITAVITVGFALALIVLLVVRDQLPHADRWWIWVAAFGTFLGVFGLVYVPILKRQRDRAAARRAAEHGSRPGGSQGQPDNGCGDEDTASEARADTRRP
jgi:Protein of unknown function (DUF2530)